MHCWHTGCVETFWDLLLIHTQQVQMTGTYDGALLFANVIVQCCVCVKVTEQ